MSNPTPEQKAANDARQRQFMVLALMNAPFLLIGLGLLYYSTSPHAGWALWAAIVSFAIGGAIVLRGVSRIAKAQAASQDKV